MTIGQRLVDVLDDTDVSEARALGMFARSDVCDMCRAGRLVSEGVMPATVASGELHAQCREPGECACDCQYARGGRCHNCHRIRTQEQLTVAGECIDRENCAIAMLAADPAPDAVKAPKSSRAGTKRASRPPSAPKAQARECTCGCGEMTGGGVYRPGHDSRHVKRLNEDVRGGSETLDAALAALPSEALRAKLQKQLGVAR